MYVVLGENYDLTIEASELTQHVTSSSRPTANDNDDDARVTSPVDDDVELLAVTKKKIRKKRKRSRKPEQTGEDITTEQIDKGFFLFIYEYRTDIQNNYFGCFLLCELSIIFSC